MGLIVFAMRMWGKRQLPNGKKAWGNLKKAMADGKISKAEWVLIGDDLGLLD